MIVCEFAITPIGAGESLSAFVARCERIVRQSGLPHQLTPMGTVIEGEWDEVLAVIRACHMAVRADVRRVSTLIRIDDREGPGGRLERKVRSVEEKLAASEPPLAPPDTLVGRNVPPDARSSGDGVLPEGSHPLRGRWWGDDGTASGSGGVP